MTMGNMWKQLRKSTNEIFFYVDCTDGVNHDIKKVYAKNSIEARKKVESILDSGWRVCSVNAA